MQWSLTESIILEKKNILVSGKIEKFHFLWKNVWQFKIFVVYLYKLIKYKNTKKIKLWII